jgi:NADP-dependent 3-hydroxy acid dehydrogenase YdfG
VSELGGRVALVTGASAGIGRAIAARLAARGARVLAVGRDEARLAALAAEAEGGVLPRACDLAADGAAEALVAELRELGFGLDLLVHCAGAHALAPLAAARVEDFDAQWRVNLRAAWLLTRAALPLLAAAGGDVVFVNSSVVRHPRAEAGPFAATQHALLGVADSLREELNPRGVRVLSVFPGRTATPRQQRLHAAEGRPYRPEALLQPEDVASVVVHAVSLPRTAEVTEIHVRPMRKA